MTFGIKVHLNIQAKYRRAWWNPNSAYSKVNWLKAQKMHTWMLKEEPGYRVQKIMSSHFQYLNPFTPLASIIDPVI